MLILLSIALTLSELSPLYHKRTNYTCMTYICLTLKSYNVLLCHFDVVTFLHLWQVKIAKEKNEHIESNPH